MLSIIEKKIKSHNEHAKESACFVLNEHKEKIPKDNLNKIKAIADGTLERFTFVPDKGIDEVRQVLKEFVEAPLPKSVDQVCSYLCVHAGIHDNLYDKKVNVMEFDLFFYFMDVYDAIAGTFIFDDDKNSFHNAFVEYSEEYNKDDRNVKKLLKMEQKLIEEKEKNRDYLPILPGMVVFSDDNGGNGYCVNLLSGELYYFDHETGIQKFEYTSTLDEIVEEMFTDYDEFDESPDESILDFGVKYKVILGISDD